MESYGTQSLYEASFLICSGFKLEFHQKNGFKSTLFFKDSFKLQKAIMGFYNGEGSVSAKMLFDTYRTLKDMVFQRPSLTM